MEYLRCYEMKVHSFIEENMLKKSMYLSKSDKFIFVKNCDIFKILQVEKYIKDYLDKWGI